MKAYGVRWYENVIYLFLAGALCPPLFGYMLYKRFSSPSETYFIDLTNSD